MLFGGVSKLENLVETKPFPSNLRIYENALKTSLS